MENALDPNHPIFAPIQRVLKERLQLSNYQASLQYKYEVIPDCGL